MGALDQGEDPPSKTMVMTQLKKSERTLRGIISGAVANVSRLVTKDMTKAQYHKTSHLVKKLLVQVREEYQDIFIKLDFAILSEEQTSEEDTTLRGTTEAFLMRMLDEAISI